MTKIFSIPFAETGDKTTVPDAVQSDGSVSYTEGFGPDYSADQSSDPSALDVPRDQTNQILNDVTGAVQQYQIDGACVFSTLLVYNKYSRVRFDDGVNGFRVYESLADSNTAFPTDTTKWHIISSDYSITPATLQQSGFIYAVNSGTANDLLAVIVPSYGTLQAGMTISIKVTTTNTGALTLNGDPVNVMTPLGLLACNGGETKPGIFNFKYTGSVWQLMNPAITRSIYAIVSFTPTGSQSVPTGDTKIHFNNIVYDPYSWWDPVNFRFIPTLIGKFELSAACYGLAVSSSQGLRVFQNSTFVRNLGGTANATGPDNCIPSGTSGELITANTFEYFELFWHNESRSNTIIGENSGSNGDKNFFQIKYVGN